MVAFLLFLIMFVVGAVLVYFVLAWILREHLDARKYRAMAFAQAKTEAKHPAPTPSGPQWAISYRERGTVRSVTVSGATEAEALREFVKEYHVGYGNIVDSKQV